MAQITMEVPEELGERIRPLETWLPTVLELSLVGFQSQAAATATEVMRFLSTAPSLQEILDYHVSETAQTRLQRLLALNEAGLLGIAEQRELDELEQTEHTVILLKAQAAVQGMPGAKFLSPPQTDPSP